MRSISWLLIVAALLVATPSAATVTYRYTGLPFASITDATPPAGACAESPGPAT